MPTLTSTTVSQLTTQGVKITKEGVPLGEQYLAAEVIQERREDWNAVVNTYGLKVIAQIDETHVLFEIPEEDTEKLRDDLEQVQIEVLEGYLNSDVGIQVASQGGDRTGIETYSAGATVEHDVLAENICEPDERASRVTAHEHAALPFNRMLSALEGYRGTGLTCVSLSLLLECNEQGLRKKPLFERGWKDATFENQKEYWNDGLNAVAIKTGRLESGCVLFVVDVDNKGSETEAHGLQAWECLLNGRPIPHGTPVARSCNGGLHVYLRTHRDIPCMTKLKVDGKTSAIDVRGIGGIIFAPPTSCGSESYRWVSNQPTRCEDIPMAPDFIEEWIWGQLVKVEDRCPKVLAIVGERMEADEDSDASYKSFEEPVPDLFLINRIKRILAVDLGDNDSVFRGIRRYKERLLYVFQVRGARVCPQGNAHTGNNNFWLEVDDEGRVMYGCHSSECKGNMRVVGIIPERELRRTELGAVSETDSVIYSRLSFDFMLSTLLSNRSDYAAASVFKRMYACGRVKVDLDDEFWVYDGRIFKKTSSTGILKCVQLQLHTAYTMHKKQLASWVDEIEEKISEEEGGPKLLKALRKKVLEPTNYAAVSNAKNAIQSIRSQLRDDEFVDKLQSRAGFICCKNGMLEAATGKLLPHSPEYMCSMMTDVRYMGIDYDTPLPERLVATLMDEETLPYESREKTRALQKILSVCLFGENKHNLLVLFLGRAGNGKSTLTQYLLEILGESKYGYGLTMSAAVLFTEEGQQKAAEGSAQSHMARLKDKHLGVLSETGPGAKFNEAQAKRVTGNETLACRDLFAQMVSFVAKLLPLVCTNMCPMLSGDAGLKRRLVAVNFDVSFKDTLEELDPNNTRLKLKDPDLLKRLKTPEGLSQGMSWLAQGAIRLHNEGYAYEQLPESFKAFKDKLYADSDSVQEFIDTVCEVCEVHRNCPKDCDHSEFMTPYTQLYDMYHRANSRSKSDIFKRDIEIKGFEKSLNPVTLPGGGRARVVRGIRLSP